MDSPLLIGTCALCALPTYVRFIRFTYDWIKLSAGVKGKGLDEKLYKNSMKSKRAATNIINIVTKQWLFRTVSFH